MALLETYVANLKAIPADVPKANRVFVMRHRGHDHLAPGEQLFNDFKAREAELKAQGLGPVAAHNQAFEDVDYVARFTEQITADPEAVRELKELRARAETEDVYLICYEKPPKRCHRFLLLDLAERV